MYMYIRMYVSYPPAEPMCQAEDEGACGKSLT